MTKTIFTSIVSAGVLVAVVGCGTTNGTGQNVASANAMHLNNTVAVANNRASNNIVSNNGVGNSTSNTTSTVEKAKVPSKTNTKSSTSTKASASNKVTSTKVSTTSKTTTSTAPKTTTSTAPKTTTSTAPKTTTSTSGSSTSTKPSSPTPTLPTTSGEDTWATDYLNSSAATQMDGILNNYKGVKESVFDGLLAQVGMGSLSASTAKSEISSMTPWKDSALTNPDGNVLLPAGTFSVGRDYIWTENYSAMPNTNSGMASWIINDTPVATWPTYAGYAKFYVYFNAKIKKYTVVLLQIDFQSIN